MTSTGAKWLWGCGIGCGLIILIAAILGGAGLFFMRDTIRDVGEVFRDVAAAEESQEELVDSLGSIEDFVPPEDGIIQADRMEIFLSIREGLRERRNLLESSVSDLPLEGFEGRDPSFGEVVEVIGSIGSLVSPMVEYIAVRNRDLLDRQMGLGEYVYIYSMVYYSWLGYSPEDGPEVRGERILDGDDSAFGSRQVRQRYRRYMLTFLRNQLESIVSPDLQEWRHVLENELRGFEANPGRIAWRQGLPPDMEFALEPFRERCESTYHRSTNCLELPPRDGERWHFSDHN
jgi:hypothetical protein